MLDTRESPSSHASGARSRDLDTAADLPDLPGATRQGYHWAAHCGPAPVGDRALPSLEVPFSCLPFGLTYLGNDTNGSICVVGCEEIDTSQHHGTFLYISKR